MVRGCEVQGTRSLGNEGGPARICVSEMAPEAYKVPTLIEVSSFLFPCLLQQQSGAAPLAGRRFGAGLGQGWCRVGAGLVQVWCSFGPTLPHTAPLAHRTAM